VEIVQEIVATDGKAPEPEADRPVHVIVGIGNPGKEYDNTPHSVGYRALDRLAALLKVAWRREENALVARTEWKSQHILLVKLLVYVNETGPALAKLGRRIGFGHTECLLVHDDLDLPLGKVRTRLRGGDGGHRGVRSVLISFQTDEVRRVKIGVGRRSEDAKESVLTPFTAEEIPRIEEASERATKCVMELLRPSRPLATGQ
jgi:PTH1 family peptidyl-tRNA hydrolase